MPVPGISSSSQDYYDFSKKIETISNLSELSKSFMLLCGYTGNGRFKCPLHDMPSLRFIENEVLKEHFKTFERKTFIESHGDHFHIVRNQILIPAKNVIEAKVTALRRDDAELRARCSSIIKALADLNP